MPYTTFIQAQDAAQHLQDPGWVFVDCRFVLMDTEKGWNDYQQAHIAGATYAHLDRDLSGTIIKGVTGRHPLPAKDALLKTFNRLGIGNHAQVVAYDETAGHLAACRLWWLLRWAGHTQVAVLDGGLKAWNAANLPTRAGVETAATAPVFEPRWRDDLIAEADEIAARLGDPNFALMDVRAADRYRGENEVIDPIAGHIPGAVCAPSAQDILPEGRIKPAGQLLQEWGELRPAQTVTYCGSGVTAAYKALAFAHAGLPLPRIYPGSWSEWITDARRPRATGAENAAH